MSANDRYLVHAEHGEYSDWCFDPLGIFDTEAEAREFASHLRVCVNECGSIPDWRDMMQTDTLEPLVAKEDGTYRVLGLGEHDGCAVFVTKFEGGIGVFPSWIEVEQ
ncbi:MAG: hypothetical protein IKF78_16145 [Atopobiaceae bacterium]|nr:hypothetical protein [Atopobiaceae bacterium]